PLSNDAAGAINCCGVLHRRAAKFHHDHSARIAQRSFDSGCRLPELPEFSSRIPERTQISYVTCRNYPDPLTPYHSTGCTFLFMHPGRKPMTIGQVAKLSGVGVETIRFYEREGLLNKPKRKESGYRLFEAEVVTRIKFIKRAK